MADKISNGAAILEMQDVDISMRTHPRVIRVAGVDWKVAAGEYWVVGGPPESGKTELLSTSAGLHRPARGTVRLFGESLGELAEPDLLKQRARIGFVFDSGGRIFSDMTVAENIALPLRYHHNHSTAKALEVVHALLQLTEMGDIGSENPQRLGAATHLRLDLARALAMKPEILFLDEPLVGLDWRHRQWWLDFLQRLTAGIPFMDGKKAAVVVTTNDFTPWRGRPVRYALIRDKRWQTLGEVADPPNV
jgi:ABC-type transporter Mla maintaining outer membrane lipid asymmetry ATPase subunit MlaF